MTRRETCGACRGTGTARVVPSPCGVCEGTGTSKTIRGYMVFTRSCQACGGTGRQRPRACDVCAGAGYDTRAEAVPVPVPAGVVDGVSVRVAGKGHAGMRGGPAGDLYVTVTVQAHPVFRRDGDDVHMTVPVAVHEAALGARVAITTPDGPARLRIPPGTQSGQRFRLRERGVVSSRDGRRGDLIVHVRMVLPAVLDERSKELLREFARLNPGDVRQAAVDDPVSA